MVANLENFVGKAAVPVNFGHGLVNTLWNSASIFMAAMKNQSRVLTQFQKTRVVSFVAIPLAFAQLGFHIRDAVVAVKSKSQKKMLWAGATLLQDGGQLTGTTACIIEGFQYFNLLTRVSSVALGALYATSGFLSSISLALTIRNLRNRILFEKKLDEPAKLTQNEVERALDVSDGANIMKKLSEQETIEKLKARVKRNKWSDKLDLVIQSVFLVATVVLLFSPPGAVVAGFVLASLAGTVSLVKLGVDYYQQRQFEKTFKE